MTRKTCEPPPGVRITPWVEAVAERTRRRICERQGGPTSGKGHVAYYDAEGVVAYVLAGHSTREAVGEFGCHIDRVADYLRDAGCFYDRARNRWTHPQQLEG